MSHAFQVGVSAADTVCIRTVLVRAERLSHYITTKLHQSIKVDQNGEPILHPRAGKKRYSYCSVTNLTNLANVALQMVGLISPCLEAGKRCSSTSTHHVLARRRSHPSNDPR